ncbi:hypothetical protein SAMN05421832_10261 [Psychrobacillus psychrodurans]|nr:hypothetical protein SAMN05421832_10261 [Psychrobacillus psychrodurans]
MYKVNRKSNGVNSKFGFANRKLREYLGLRKVNRKLIRKKPFSTKRKVQTVEKLNFWCIELYTKISKGHHFAFRGLGFSLLVTAKTYAPAVTRRKDIGQTKFDQCPSCGVFCSSCSHRSLRGGPCLINNSLKVSTIYTFI